MFINKKGIGIDDTIAFIIFLFIAAIGLFFFRFNENLKSAELVDDIKLQKDIQSGHEVLMEYLSKIDENGNSKADFISKSIIEKNNEILKKDLMDYFGKRLENLNWYIEVKDSSGNLIFPALTNAHYSPQEQYSSTKVANSVSSMIIPIKNQNYISLELFFA